ncbi:MAG: asparagine synthase (glutamine-hydrolyzing) [Planctomycetaceae bacterium]|nr:asparagine synthase (glutamine-hydrolyzing) [Planctomycetaceae bacterium]
MCGIAGIINLAGGPLPAFDPRAVLSVIHHRGPDDRDFFRDGSVFLGATRLAIIDPAHGRQPVQDESGRHHLVMNGEIYDYDQIRSGLVARGHVVKSHCDTEVAVHLFEEKWLDALEVIDGQYAIALWDSARRRGLLARDRMGICPLFYAVAGDCLVFGSEMKAIFATGLVKPRIDVRSIDSVMALGCAAAPRAMFEGIRSLGPGRYLEIVDGRLREGVYWDIPYPDAGQYEDRPADVWASEFHDIFQAATCRRLKADVPVGLYLSGGIDSASVAAMANGRDDVRKRVFTIGFPEPSYDESHRTQRLAEALDIEVHRRLYRQQDLAADLPKLIYHGEAPMLSTESVPLMSLSELASRHVKVVLTGEGSDEALGGYEYFRWEAMRQRCGAPLSVLLNLFMKPLFAYSSGRRNPFIPQADDTRYAHSLFGFFPSVMITFLYFRAVREMIYTPEMLARSAACDDSELVNLPRETMNRWDQLNRSMYVSSRVFMTNHLLGSHGDRALMANSVEGRYPFLDRTVQEFLARVPPLIKTRWTSQKYLLRRAMAGRLPQEVLQRVKKPFLAPFGTPFVGDDATDYVRHLLEERTLRRFGYFDPASVARIVSRLEQCKAGIAAERQEPLRLGRAAIERTMMGMALTMVVSTQVLADKVDRGEYAPRAGGYAATGRDHAYAAPAPAN